MINLLHIKTRTQDYWVNLNPANDAKPTTIPEALIHTFCRETDIDKTSTDYPTWLTTHVTLVDHITDNFVHTYKLELANEQSSDNNTVWEKRVVLKLTNFKYLKQI